MSSGSMPGQVGVEDEAILLFLDVDARHPLAGHHGAVVGVVLVEEVALEQAVEHLPDLILQRALARPLAVTNDIHLIASSFRC